MVPARESEPGLSGKPSGDDDMSTVPPRDIVDATADQIPRLAANTLHRAHLQAPSKQDRVVALVAPPGYGKTTLAVQWFYESARRHAAGWLQIDQRCRDPAIFVRRLAAALNVTWYRMAGDYYGSEDCDAAMDSTLSQVRGRGATHFLFVDDAQLLIGWGAMLHFQQLMHAAPGNLVIVLTSREADGLGLSSLAQRGAVRWIASAQLALSREEIAALAERNRVELGPADLETIATATEGWPALAQLALYGIDMGKGLDSWSSGQPGVPVTSYIHDRFLAGLTKRDRSLVSILAVLPEATRPLIEELLPDAKLDRLSRFEQMGLIRQTGQVSGNPCFAMHPLISEEIGRRDWIEADWRHGVQSRAAIWWWNHGGPEQAIRLALAAGMNEDLRRWLRCYGPILVHREGRHDTFLDILSSAERLWGGRDPELASCAVSALMFLRRYGEAESLLNATGTGAAGHAAPPGSSDPADLQRAVIAGLRDDYLTAGRFAESWLASGGGEPFHEGMAWIVIAFSKKCAGRFQETEASLDRARQVLSCVDAVYGIAWVHVVGALSLLKQGRYREVLAEVETAVRLLGKARAGVADLVSLLKATGALVHHERGDFERCSAALEEAMPHLHRQGIVDAMLAGYVAAARLHASQGRHAAALDVLAEGQRVGAERGFSRLQVSLTAERAVLLARIGATREAREAADSAGLLAHPRSGVQRDKNARLIVRLALADGRLAEAGAVLRPALAHARSSGQRHKLVELLLLDALQLHHAGSVADACAALTESLEIGISEGYLRVFLDEGAPLSHLLYTFLRRPEPDSPARAFAREILERLSSRLDAAAAAAEPLSDRERQVLRLLAEGYSNLEMSQKLFLTEGTVKWHLHNIYGKLGVGTRTAAIRAATLGGLLARGP